MVRAPTTVAGRRGEKRAVAELRRRRYTVVERNFRTAVGEIDIVARDGDVLVFVEVRSRSDAAHGMAAETVDRKKRQRLAQVARAYLAQRNPDYRECRFDVVDITGDQLTVIEDAFYVGLDA